MLVIGTCGQDGIPIHGVDTGSLVGLFNPEVTSLGWSLLPEIWVAQAAIVLKVIGPKVGTKSLGDEP